MTKTKDPIIATREAVVNELRHRMAARLDAIEDEFSKGFEVISKHQAAVTVFGSARFKEDNKYYQQARDFGGLLSYNGYTVVTGGGGGIMEAANRGAYEAGGQSIGFNIALPNEQQLNPYVTESMAFQHFYARKVMLVFSATALVVFPGGFGTLDEMFEVLTLVQTRKTPKLPIILVGKEFWAPLDEFITQKLVSEEVINAEDKNLYLLTDDLEEAMQTIDAYREANSVFAAKDQESALVEVTK